MSVQEVYRAGEGGRVDALKVEFDIKIGALVGSGVLRDVVFWKKPGGVNPLEHADLEVKWMFKHC